MTTHRACCLYGTLAKIESVRNYSRNKELTGTLHTYRVTAFMPLTKWVPIIEFPRVYEYAFSF